MCILGAERFRVESHEPRQLRRGKAFHKTIQQEWRATAIDGEPHSERTIRRLNGRYGRVDVLVEELGDMVSVIEIKCTDWDRMTEANVVRNVKRQIRQIWTYVEAELELYGCDVCPGVIFPKLPRSAERLGLIETMFNSEGIQVVWHNEGWDQLKKRMH